VALRSADADYFARCRTVRTNDRMVVPTLRADQRLRP